MKEVEIHSDGACQGNPGPGGWAVILISGAHTREISGGEPATTNNRMEIRAAIEAFAALKTPCTVTFHTDSNYLRNGAMSWIHGWKRNGWLTSAKQPVKNGDLWKELDAKMKFHKVTWKWVKGHSGHTENERCDALATEEVAKIKSRYTKAQLKEFVEGLKSGEDSGLLPGV